MQNTWRTQVRRTVIAVIATVAVAGGVQIANEGTAAGTSSVTADATTPQAPAAAQPTSTVTASPDHNEWG